MINRGSFFKYMKSWMDKPKSTNVKVILSDDELYVISAWNIKKFDIFEMFR